MAEKIATREVIIKPLPVERWHGKKDKESFARDKSHEVLYSSAEGGYQTGLTPEEEETYGKLLQRDLSKSFHPETPHPYWSTKEARMVLKNHTEKLNLTKPKDYVLYKNMRASKFVANSLKEWQDGNWPEATHYIIDEEENVKDNANKVQLTNLCIQRLSKLTHDDKVKMIQLMTERVLKNNSADFVDVEIDTVLRKDPETFLRYLDLGRVEIYDRALILESLYKNLLTRANSQIFYMGEFIGFDVQEAVQYLNNPANQRVKAILQEKLLNLK